MAGFGFKTCAALLLLAAAVNAQSVPQGGPPEGKQALASADFAKGKTIYEEYLKTHAGSVPGELGLADALLGLHKYEAAEQEYRSIIAVQPELWIVHKNLVLIEAALGRWDEFDRERAVLRAARERGAPGISARESDVIDTITVHGKRWIVREYYEPVGRSQTRYNFEQFSPDGKVKAFISLESEAAAKAAYGGGSVAIGREPKVNADVPSKGQVLNWYTGKAHGTIARYLREEPKYETLRAAVVRWLRIQTS
jgi:hypothetical protein